MATTPINAVTVSNSKENIKFILNNPGSDETTGTQIGDLKKEYNRFAGGEINPPTTWAEVKEIVRSGKAPIYFSIGDQFSVTKNIYNLTIEKVTNSKFTNAIITNYINCITAINETSELIPKYLEYNSDSSWIIYVEDSNTGNIISPGTTSLDHFGITIVGTPSVGDKIIIHDTQELLFDIIGFNHEDMGSSATSFAQYTMTLQLHDVYTEMPFDMQEATWYLDPTVYPDGLASGTYQYNNDGATYVFTTTKAVPSGGQLQLINGNICTYNSATSDEPIECVSMATGTAENSLPDIITDVMTHRTNITNNLHKTLHGSSNYSESIVRQYINSSDQGNWWVPKNNFDRTPEYSIINIPGFLYGIDSEFLNIVRTVDKNTYNDYVEIDTTSDKFFLLSAREIYAADKTTESYPYQYYGDPDRNTTYSYPYNAANSNRAKYLITDTVRTSTKNAKWWLRSSDPSTHYQTKCVWSKGIVRATSPKFIYGVCPACVI